MTTNSNASTPLALVMEDLNRRGVESLMQWSYSEATMQFRTALTETNHRIHDEQNGNRAELLQLAVTRPILVNHHRQEGDETTALLAEDDNNVPNEQDDQVQQQQEQQDEATTAATAAAEADHNAFFRVYDKAFVFSRRLTQDGQAQQRQEQQEAAAALLIPLVNGDATFSYMTAVVLYNAGVTHHIRGLVTIETQDRDYRRSLRFYRLGSDLIAPVAVNGEAPPPQIHVGRLRLLLLAFYNNMAHIHLHFFDETAFTQCLNAMRHVLGAGPPTAEDELFTMNLVVSQTDAQRAAPMA